MSTNQQNGPWFVLLNGSSVGPLPLDELRSLSQRAVVNEQTMVSMDGRNWQMAAHAISSLFGGQATGSTSGSYADYFKPGEQWFANTHDGKQYGPVSYTELMSWIVGKTLTPSCLVRRESDPQWHRVGDVFGGKVATSQPTVVASSPRPAAPTFVPPPSKPRKTVAKQKEDSDPAEWLITIVGTVIAVAVIILFVRGMGELRTRGYVPLALFAFVVIRGLVSLMSSKK